MANPNWKPGVSGNPHGRPAGAGDQRGKLLDAIKDLEAKEGIPFWPTVLKLAISQAQKGKSDLLKELVKKLLPDQVEAKGDYYFNGYEFETEEANA